LGVLVGPKQGPSARTAWQADFKELRTLRIALLGDDAEVRELRGVLGAGLENLAIGLRTRSFELEIRHNPGPAIDHYESDVAIISSAFKTLLGMGEQMETDPSGGSDRKWSRGRRISQVDTEI
jgi:hypothetical protein